MADDASTTTKRKPPPGRPWKKGQSGNPGGRPKDAKVVLDLLLESSDVFVQGLIAAARKGNVYAIVKGLEIIIPKQISGPGGGPLQVQHLNLKALSDEELERLGSLVARAAAADDSTPVTH